MSCLDISAVFWGLESERDGLLKQNKKNEEQSIQVVKQNSKNQYNFNISPTISMWNTYIIHAVFLFSGFFLFPLKER